MNFFDNFDSKLKSVLNENKEGQTSSNRQINISSGYSEDKLHDFFKWIILNKKSIINLGKFSFKKLQNDYIQSRKKSNKFYSASEIFDYKKYPDVRDSNQLEFIKKFNNEAKNKNISPAFFKFEDYFKLSKEYVILKEKEKKDASVWNRIKWKFRNAPKIPSIKPPVSNVISNIKKGLLKIGSFAGPLIRT